MRILGLDTATAATAVAILDGEHGHAVERRDDPPSGERPRHTARLLGLVAETLDAAGTDWGQIDRIAVGVGPGTFTGLRIGVATALALGRARGIPVVGVSTLHALALGAAAPARHAGGDADDPDDPDDRDDADDPDAIVAVIDARRGEVFAGGWALDVVAQPDAEPLLAPQALPRDGLAAALALAGRRWLAAGDGSVAFGEALERSGARIAEGEPERNRVSAVEHCRLALGLRAEVPEAVRPEYLRLPDAEISFRAARQR